MITEIKQSTVICYIIALRYSEVVSHNKIEYLGSKQGIGFYCSDSVASCDDPTAKTLDDINIMADCIRIGATGANVGADTLTCVRFCWTKEPPALLGAWGSSFEDSAVVRRKYLNNTPFTQEGPGQARPAVQLR